jgi:hypothetical protein
MDVQLISPGYTELAYDILHCERCSWRKLEDGYYPKFGGGSLYRPLIFIVSQNPGQPSCEEVANGPCPTAHLALRTTNSGSKGWLKRISWGTFEAAANTASFVWGRDLYVTQAIKCPRKGTPTTEELETAQRECNGYLVRELEMLKPRHIITLGQQAYKAVEIAMGASLNPIKVTEWWESEPLRPIRVDGRCIYPLFLPYSTASNTGNHSADFAQALDKVFTLISQSVLVKPAA